ncbi:YjgH family protein [Talaromyces stipitatus ATCC 10500]|uniref:YjgH family protein n=1 Tax=Talaromyces stipitatus (strain ATCC 10500 / CBS 375.48 / QM 6759 / NRRL 1006) TaxID=441959 RepID=B8MI16_TALSN|nr:YjgH family protein [Talaromyces stipitatus ATCC 10500]EED17178.1 YjgH family protein [Talaromyces stipitatus ATCC 10500]
MTFQVEFEVHQHTFAFACTQSWSPIFLPGAEIRKLYQFKIFRSRYIQMSVAIQKQFYGTNSPWELSIGHYRAVRHGQLIYVSGSTAADPDSSPNAPGVLFPGDARKQALYTFGKIIDAIKALGGRGAESIVRTRMFVRRQEDCSPVSEAFRDILGRDNGSGIGTAATMVIVAGFCDPNMLVEIECDAVADAE